jgi:aldose 1-epimerase
MKSSITETKFGKLNNGETASLYTLDNGNGLTAKITNFGTIITELHAPDRHGKPGDVVLGFDNLGQYLKKHPYFGCTVGRVANRIGKARFVLDGKTYTLAANDGRNHLHGGLKGFDKALWQAQPLPGAAVRFTYTSPDGEEGYPGTLAVSVVMTLTDDNALRLEYSATTDQATPVNLTNHSYFNLEGSGDVLAQEMMIAADFFTESDVARIPTGEIKPVKGTVMDFTKPRPIGSPLPDIEGNPPGYDQNFVLNSGGKSLALAARAVAPASGRVMEVLTTEPGVQLYTANFLDGSLTGKQGVVYRRHMAFCLETQHFADAVNQPAFPSTILRPGQTYRQTTIYKFSTH